MEGSGSVQIITDLDYRAQKHTDPTDTDPEHSLKVPKCEILISWILMIFYHKVSKGRGL
jgi:hypothetical protein